MQTEAIGPIELSIVIPCLNEGETLEHCIRKAQDALRDGNINGEIIIADNGSRDDSIKIAQRLGAHVVHVAEKGYGNALMGGLSCARGKYFLMGDADGSYDFGEAPRFVAKLREGFDLVQGCRLPAGGGAIAEGAMPITHRLIGNPAFSFLARNMFKARINDIYCGLRAFTRELYQKLELRCIGMEFATEMIIKASLTGANIAEIPITLHKDLRVSNRPHLKTIRDGWRTLRFFLLCSPRWLFFIPGMALMFLGFVGYGLALPAVKIGPATFDAHTLLFASLGLMLGYQSIWFAVIAKTFAITEGLLPDDSRFAKFLRITTLERGLILGVMGMMAGGFLMADAVLQWRAVSFGHLDYSYTMRWVIPGVTLCALGFQTILSCFIISLLGLARK
jgi:glycosyltransferase involved in cell wall biosynthesis